MGNSKISVSMIFYLSFYSRNNKQDSVYPNVYNMTNCRTHTWIEVFSRARSAISSCAAPSLLSVVCVCVHVCSRSVLTLALHCRDEQTFTIHLHKGCPHSCQQNQHNTKFQLDRFNLLTVSEANVATWSSWRTHNRTADKHCVCARKTRTRHSADLPTLRQFVYALRVCVMLSFGFVCVRMCISLLPILLALSENRFRTLTHAFYSLTESYSPSMCHDPKFAWLRRIYWHTYTCTQTHVYNL